MAKKAAKKSPQRSQSTTVTAGEIPVVGAREDCPCGSGRRYKACHGREAAHAVQELVHRPFEGLPGEADWVALRELVPAATVPLTLLPEVAASAAGEVPSVTLATVLPLAWPALRRQDGSILLGLQTQSSSGDLSRDLADALELALATEPGTPVPARRTVPGGRRLQELLDVSAGFAPDVHTGFEFWLEDAETATGEVAASLERANASAIPTQKLTSVDSSYWCAAPDKNHLRWVMTVPEEQLLDALARLTAADRSSLGPDTRLVGSFRAHGLTVPVWDLPSEMTAEDCEKPAAEFAERLADTLKELASSGAAPLTAEERRARANLVNRQVTLN
ncbi:DUF5926 family protein [Kitasatospora atroaurantiaca]|uniref:SEC-C motif-containing protein n=1 Tax=Kitasatospora atroaurantiaca TaxID=285545 RepID=A0A561ES67_9ACTN|nr:DUF5926 family protein [Kitasatospora atroaurantiaca]TWE18446.1 SEC-C motif-containing protein [Kitasatospora atroaurantiaca]